MEKAPEANIVISIKVGKGKMMVSHLQFADDTLFSSSEKVQMIDNLLKVVEVFSLISAPKLNKAKSFVVGINSAEEKVNALANQFGKSIGS